jgi:hypothetical protein
MEPEQIAVRVEGIDGRLGRLEARVNEYAPRIRAADNFILKFEALETDRERRQQQRHTENSEKLEQVAMAIGRKTLWSTVAGVFLTAASVLVGIAAIVVMVKGHL